MGSKKYLLLTPDELRRVLKAFGFMRKRTRGDHEQWEGMTNEKRRVITVQRKILELQSTSFSKP